MLLSSRFASLSILFRKQKIPLNRESMQDSIQKRIEVP
jgi:hypothetical protein